MQISSDTICNSNFNGKTNYSKKAVDCEKFSSIGFFLKRLNIWHFEPYHKELERHQMGRADFSTFLGCHDKFSVLGIEVVLLSINIDLDIYIFINRL